MILAERKEKELTGGKSLADFATGHLFFGLHRTHSGWVIREWAPNATHIYLVGTFNDWQESADYSFSHLDHGVWELHLATDQLAHGDLYALNIHWAVNHGKRIPAWATRVVQDENTHMFNAQVWAPANAYEWKTPGFSARRRATADLRRACWNGRRRGACAYLQ